MTRRHSGDISASAVSIVLLDHRREDMRSKHDLDRLRFLTQASTELDRPTDEPGVKPEPHLFLAMIRPNRELNLKLGHGPDLSPGRAAERHSASRGASCQEATQTRQDRLRALLLQDAPRRWPGRAERHTRAHERPRADAPRRRSLEQGVIGDDNGANSPAVWAVDTVSLAGSTLPAEESCRWQHRHSQLRRVRHRVAGRIQPKPDDFGDGPEDQEQAG